MPDPTFHLVSMRPRGDHAGLRRAAARHGGRVLALSPWRIEARSDEATRQFVTGQMTSFERWIAQARALQQAG